MGWLLMVLLVKNIKIKQVLNIPSNQALAHFLGQVATKLQILI
jgi:hypothetical protein